MNFRKTTLALAIASSLALVGCGGGGGGSSATGSDSGAGGSPSVKSVSGSAVKGIMKFATVRAYELDDRGERIGEVGSAETDANGQYELSLSESYEGGLLDIEVTVNNRTRMVCDTQACGEQGADITLPASFKLTAIVASANGDEALSAPITAWSTMASKRARALIAEGKTASDANRQAIAEVNQVAGFDISRTNARAVTNLEGASAEEQQAAVMNAVVAELIFGGGDVAEGIERFSAALDDGIAGNDGDSFSPELLASTTLQIVNSQPNLAPEARDSLNTKVAEYENSAGGVVPVYDENLIIAEGATEAEKIQAFKEFVSQVRSWATSIESLDSAQLEAVIGAQAQTFENVLGGNANSLQMTLDIAGQALSVALSDPTALQAALVNGTAIEVPLLDGEVAVGSLDLTFADNDGIVITASGAVTGEAQATYLPFDLTLNTSIPAAALDLNASAVKALATRSNIVLSGTFENGSGVTLARLNDLALQLDLNTPVSNAVGLTTEDVNAAFNSASFQGEVQLLAETGESFTGNIEARATRLVSNQFTTLNDVPVSLERLRVAGDFTNQDGSVFKASAALNVNNSASFDTFAFLDYSEASVSLNEPVDAAALLAGFELPDDVASANVQLQVNRGASDELVGALEADWYVGDGELRQYSAAFEDAQIAEVANATRQALISALPPTLTLSYPDGAGSSVEVELDVASAITNGEFSSVYVGFVDSRATIQINLASNPLPAGQSYADIVSGLAGEDLFNNFVSIFDDVSGPVVQLNLDLSAPANTTALFDGLRALVPLTDAVVEDVSFSETFGFGSASIQRPSDFAYYSECLASPVEQLLWMGQFYQPEFNSPSSACAWATLTLEGFSRDATPQELATAEAVTLNAYETRYGDLGSQVRLDNFFVYTFEGEGWVFADGDFPNLETAENFLDASFTVSTSVNVPELPEARVSATVSRNSIAGGRVRATVGWDGGQYSLDLASANVENLSEVTARFFNPQGYELQLAAVFDEAGDLAGITGDALINGEDIGDVTTRNGVPVITYPNGTTTEFETLF